MNLLKRTLVTVLGIPTIFILIKLGNLYLLALVMAQAGLCAWEFSHLARSAQLKVPSDWISVFFASIIPPAVLMSINSSEPLWFVAAVAASLLVLPTVFLVRLKSTQGALAGISVSMFTALFFGGLFSFELLLRHGIPSAESNGANWLLLAYLATWSVDVGSYAAGKIFGRNKLSPLLSPGKTVEGALGGTIITVALVWFFGSHWMGLFELPQALILGILISIAAPAGDLLESVFKRDAGVKDSSRLIPGHGGMYDRFDSLLFTVPLTFFFHLFVT